MNSDSASYPVGYGLFRRHEEFVWTPDELPNPHMLIWGMSGAGKSRLLRQIIGFLGQANKHVHVLDVHGDLGVAGDNAIELGGFNDLGGVNPFEYELSETGGPRAQVHEIVAMLRKSYLSSLGSAQEVVLRQLLLDAYLSKGIDPDNPANWLKPATLPTAADLRDLVEYIEEAIETGYADFMGEVRRMGTHLSKHAAEIDRLQHQNCQLEAAEGEHDATINSNLAVIGKLRSQVGDCRNEAIELFGRYLDYWYLGSEMPMDLVSPFENSAFLPNLRFYGTASAKRAMSTLGMYISAMVDHRVFSEQPLPVRPGVNRYDLSKLSDQPRKLFTDVVLTKVFRAVRMRGEYRKLRERRRGRAVDTFIVVDECQSVLPAREPEKKSPDQILNKIVAEARKFGLGLIVVSQSPAVLPSLFFSNIFTKIGLRTNANDVPDAVRFLGVKDRAIFNQIQKAGVAAVSNREGQFDPVEVRWDE